MRATVKQQQLQQQQQNNVINRSSSSSSRSNKAKKYLTHLDNVTRCEYENSIYLKLYDSLSATWRSGNHTTETKERTISERTNEWRCWRDEWRHCTVFWNQSGMYCRNGFKYVENFDLRQEIYRRFDNKVKYFTMYFIGSALEISNFWTPKIFLCSFV